METQILINPSILNADFNDLENEKYQYQSQSQNYYVNKNIKGYAEEFPSHLAVGLEVLSGRADAGIGIRAIAATLGLSFIPLRWERFDLMIRKDRFFDKGVQLFTGLLGQQNFKTIYDAGYGYDLEFSGKMVYPAKG